MSRVPSATTSSTNFETIFTAALEMYKKQTKKNIASHPLAAQLKSCDSPGAILAVLRTQVRTLDQSQSADEKWTKWLDPTVNVLYAFAATLGNGVGLIFPPSNAIFAGIGVLLQAVKDVRASQDALIDLFGRIEYFFQRLEKYIAVRPTAAMTDLVVKIMVEVLSVLGIVTMEIKQGRTKKFLKRLVGRKDVEDALQRLDKLTQEEARMAAAEALKVTRGIDDKVEGVDHKVGSVIQGVAETRVAIQQVVNQVTYLNRNELRKDLRKWIAPPDPSVNLNTASDAYHEGTAAWCTKGNTLADWKATGTLLWIHGKPGSGKTILSSAIIRDIKRMSDNGSAFMAYFYFDFKDTSKQDSRALLSSLLIQLSDQSDIFYDALFSLYSAHKQGSVQPANDSLSGCLKNMIMIAKQVPIYLIMDALDECPNDSGIPSSREKVLKILEELVELRYRNLHLCVTSRPEFDIRSTLAPLATHQVSLHEESGQRQDIIDYVTSVVQSDKKMKRWRDDDKDAVIEKLTQRADGMFRWVFCQLEVLRHCFPNNLRCVLEELPKSLDETYKRILNEINNGNRKHAHRLLQCLAVASRPLRVEELAEVLAVDFNAGGIPKLNADWRWEDEEEAVLSSCSSLVSVITDDGDRVVQFSHFSVKEFLTSDRLASSIEEVSRFHILIEPSHAILAQACLGVLLRLDDRADRRSVEEIPLVQYAARYWYRHAQNGDVELQIKDAMDYFFDIDKPHFSAWVRIYDIDLDKSRSRILYWRRQKDTVLISASPLYYAALCGFCGLVKRLVDKHPQHVSAQAGRRGTPLHATLSNGHIRVAHLLRERGANVNALDVNKNTPLHLVLQRGHLGFAKWLLKCDADVNPPENDGLTPLHIAALKGHIEVAQMLLERNAEVNSRDNHGRTPLLHALLNGHLDVAWLLLDHNADADVPGRSGVTPLHEAATNGRLEVSRILLEHNAEANSLDDHGCTPLLLASQNRHYDVVRLLLDHSSEAHVPGSSGVTPLHSAKTNGHLEFARILLERNAVTNSLDDHRYTSLLLALQIGHPNIARSFLDHNADADVPGSPSVAMLHKAATNGHLDIARMLLERNAEVNSRDSSGSTPLLLASQNGHLDVVQLLLDHNADAHVPGKYGHTPLHCAALKGHLEVARLLLERNAEVDSRSRHRSTPLLLASEYGHLDVVRLLLDHNADANARDDDGGTVLHCAAIGGRSDVVQMLLELNAEVNSLDNNGSTPLHLASAGSRYGSKGRPDVVRLLLDHGADAQVRNLSGKTASEVARDPGRQEIVQLLSQYATE